MSEAKSFSGFLEEYFSISPGRPGRSLRNGFIMYPLALGAIGIVVNGNPLSKVANSIGSGGSRMVGGVVQENRDGLQQTADSLYGKPTQPGALQQQSGRRCYGAICTDVQPNYQQN